MQRLTTCLLWGLHHSAPPVACRSRCQSSQAEPFGEATTATATTQHHPSAQQHSARGRGRRPVQHSDVLLPTLTQEWLAAYVGLPSTKHVENDVGFVSTEASVLVHGRENVKVGQVFLDPGLTMGSTAMFANTAHGSELNMRAEHWLLPGTDMAQLYMRATFGTADTQLTAGLELAWPYEASTDDPNDLMQYLLCCCRSCAEGVPYCIVPYRQALEG